MDAEGTVLANTPIWMDTRAQPICDELLVKVPAADIIAVAGNRLSPSYTTAKVLWFQRNAPEVFARTRWFLQCNSVVVMALTGVATQEHSQGYGLHFVDVATGAVNPDLAARLGIDPGLFPSAVEPSAVVGGVTAAAATATVAPGFMTGVIVTNSGSGYMTAPSVSLSSGSSSATATTQLNAVTGLILTNPGSGYTSAPAISFSGGGGSNAAAVVTPVKMTMQPKAIQELFDPDYGRMNATLGVELPNTNIVNQTTIPYFDIDQPSEIIKNSDAATSIGALADGTQIWKITHNGVDTHAIHWHMFNVQLINRVGWDGIVKPPDANELGWKETVRMNPLEDVIVALRPIIPDVPFDLPNSNRPLDPTMPLTSTHGFTNVDPSGQSAAVTNHVINFGWEYVWHCHLLGHEENIMMRPMVIAVAPKAPLTLTATDGSLTVNLQLVDNSLN